MSLKTENKPIKIESINARSRELTKVDKRKANVSDYEIKNPDELNLKVNLNELNILITKYLKTKNILRSSNYFRLRS